MNDKGTKPGEEPKMPEVTKDDSLLQRVAGSVREAVKRLLGKKNKPLPKQKKTPRPAFDRSQFKTLQGPRTDFDKRIKERLGEPSTPKKVPLQNIQEPDAETTSFSDVNDEQYEETREYEFHDVPDIKAFHNRTNEAIKSFFENDLLQEGMKEETIDKRIQSFFSALSKFLHEQNERRHDPDYNHKLNLLTYRIIERFQSLIPQYPHSENRAWLLLEKVIEEDAGMRPEHERVRILSCYQNAAEFEQLYKLASLVINKDITETQLAEAENNIIYKQGQQALLEVLRKHYSADPAYQAFSESFRVRRLSDHEVDNASMEILRGDLPQLSDFVAHVIQQAPYCIEEDGKRKEHEDFVHQSDISRPIRDFIRTAHIPFDSPIQQQVLSIMKEKDLSTPQKLERFADAISNIVDEWMNDPILSSMFETSQDRKDFIASYRKECSTYVLRLLPHAILSEIQYKIKHIRDAFNLSSGVFSTPFPDELLQKKAKSHLTTLRSIVTHWQKESEEEVLTQMAELVPDLVLMSIPQRVRNYADVSTALAANQERDLKRAMKEIDRAGLFLYKQEVSHLQKIDENLKGTHAQRETLEHIPDRELEALLLSGLEHIESPERREQFLRIMSTVSFEEFDPKKINMLEQMLVECIDQWIAIPYVDIPEEELSFLERTEISAVQLEVNEWKEMVKKADPSDIRTLLRKIHKEIRRSAIKPSLEADEAPFPIDEVSPLDIPDEEPWIIPVHDETLFEEELFPEAEPPSADTITVQPDKTTAEHVTHVLAKKHLSDKATTDVQRELGSVILKYMGLKAYRSPEEKNPKTNICLQIEAKHEEDGSTSIILNLVSQGKRNGGQVVLHRHFTFAPDNYIKDENGVVSLPETKTKLDTLIRQDLSTFQLLGESIENCWKILYNPPTTDTFEVPELLTYVESTPVTGKDVKQTVKQFAPFMKMYPDLKKVVPFLKQIADLGKNEGLSDEAPQLQIIAQIMNGLIQNVFNPWIQEQRTDRSGGEKTKQKGTISLDFSDLGVEPARDQPYLM